MVTLCVRESEGVLLDGSLTGLHIVGLYFLPQALLRTALELCGSAAAPKAILTRPVRMLPWAQCHFTTSNTILLNLWEKNRTRTTSAKPLFLAIIVRNSFEHMLKICNYISLYTRKSMTIASSIKRQLFCIENFQMLVS